MTCIRPTPACARRSRRSVPPAEPDGRRRALTRRRRPTTLRPQADDDHRLHAGAGAALGLSEVARVTAEMDALLKAQGLTGGSVAERMPALGKDPRFLLPNTDEGRKQLLARYQQILDEVNARMPQYFRTVPAGHTYG